MADLLNRAREQAATNDDEIINEILKDKTDALQEVKEKIRESRKPRLRTVEQYLCDGCDLVIADPQDGFVIHGNIYAADPVNIDGMIGNNFPEDKDALASSVKKIVFCKQCFLSALDLIPKHDVKSELTSMINRGRVTGR